jgi:hypothetical protein
MISFGLLFFIQVVAFRLEFFKKKNKKRNRIVKCNYLLWFREERTWLLVRVVVFANQRVFKMIFHLTKY